MVEGGEPAVWVVAGCLFEVSLPGGNQRRWRWDASGQAVTLLADAERDGRRHFRFRAEAPGAVELRFCGDDVAQTVLVHVAPEADLV